MRSVFTVKGAPLNTMTIARFLRSQS